jgi:hypothetical protein
MNIIRVIAILGVAAGLNTTTLAAADGDKPKRPNIEELDKDKDGALSKEELDAVSERFRTRLLANDTDKDGALSKEEWSKAKEAMQKRREEREKNGGRQPGETPAQ